MKSVLWFAVGLAGGFVVAHLVSKDPRGRDALAAIDAHITQFTDRVNDAYRDQDAKLNGTAP